MRHPWDGHNAKPVALHAGIMRCKQLHSLVSGKANGYCKASLKAESSVTGLITKEQWTSVFGVPRNQGEALVFDKRSQAEAHLLRLLMTLKYGELDKDEWNAACKERCLPFPLFRVNSIADAVNEVVGQDSFSAAADLKLTDVQIGLLGPGVSPTDLQQVCDQPSVDTASN